MASSSWRRSSQELPGLGPALQPSADIAVVLRTCAAVQTGLSWAPRPSLPNAGQCEQALNYTASRMHTMSYDMSDWYRPPSSRPRSDSFLLRSM